VRIFASQLSGGKPVLTAILGGKAQDALVMGDEWARKLDRAGNQEPIGGIAVLELIQTIASRGSAVAER
jgi:hypothetical protein